MLGSQLVVRVYVCVCVHMCAHVCMCCQSVHVLGEDKRQPQCHSLGPICLLFWGMPPTGTWIHQLVFCLAHEPQRSCLHLLGEGTASRHQCTPPRRSSSLHGKHFTRWAVSPGRADNTSLTKYTHGLTSGTQYQAHQYRHQDTHPWWIINSWKHLKHAKNHSLVFSWVSFLEAGSLHGYMSSCFILTLYCKGAPGTTLHEQCA